MPITITPLRPRTWHLLGIFLGNILGFLLTKQPLKVTNNKMKAKAVIDAVNERLQASGISNPRHLLSNSKLNDYRKYLKPVPKKYRGTSLYDYSEHHRDTIATALLLIARQDRKTSSAFAHAIETLNSPQINMPI